MNAGERSESLEMESKSETEKKVDVKKLVAVIPPPTMLFTKQKQVQIKEKRIRLKYDPEVTVNEAKISSRLAKELNISEYLEITVAGRKRFKFKAIIDDNVPYDYVYVNPDLMKQNGIADNSICTIRRASS